jgi:acetylornithine/N-succinyldiaminopimelate aminotransferase
MSTLSQRQLFLNNQAQTTFFPLMLEIERAEGIYMYDKDGKEYIDFISGIGVSNVGHLHKNVVEAIQNQLTKYMHLMVYGEFIQSPQTLLAQKIAEILPSKLNSTYFVNSGAEAIEGAMKLAKRVTKRCEIIVFKDAYHGSTQGALSAMGNEKFKTAFRPLLPNIKIIEYNNLNHLNYITQNTAAIIVETIQGEAGVILPEKNFLESIYSKCAKEGALYIADEIQTGFGRTGKLFGFEHFNFVPDILCVAKGMGGGMPIGAFIANKNLMQQLAFNPMLGHITTFGGHPVSCAASLACINTIIDQNLTSTICAKETLLRTHLKHSAIKDIRGYGLMYAIEFESFELNKKIIDRCIENGVITDWFLFNDKSMRIAPPLIITEQQLILACEIILKSIAQVCN